MHAPVNIRSKNQGSAVRRATREPAWVRRLLIAVALGFVGLFLLLPLVANATQAFKAGFGGYWSAVREPDALAAVKLRS